MGHISEAKLQLVGGLIEHAPDEAVRSLLMALTADGGHDEGLARVQQMVETEASERRTRNLVFDPIAPLCTARPLGAVAQFPPRTLALLWKTLKAEAPGDMAAARAAAADWRADESSPEPFDAVCERVCVALSEHDPAYEAAAQAADAGAGRAILGKALAIAPVVRGALEQLPDWLGRMTSERAAKLRLAYRDVVTIFEDAGPLFFDMLAAHMAEPWLILRIISGVMDRPTESYLAASELAVFGERVLDDVDRYLTQVTAFKAADGRTAAPAVAQAIHAVTVQLAELEQQVQVSPNGAWGVRMARQKRTLASTVEAHLKAADAAVGLALPLQTHRMGPRAARGVPRLTHDPDQANLEKAATLLIFMAETRGSAAAGGFASARAKVQEVVETRLDTYVEDLLEEIRHAPSAEQVRARAYLDLAAELCGLVRDEKAAQIVRRRAAAA